MATRRPLLMVLATATVVALGAAGCTLAPDDDTAADNSGTTESAPDQTTSTTEPPVQFLAPVGVKLEEVARLNKPVAFAVRPGGTDLFIAEQDGRVMRLVPQTANDRQTGQQGQQGQQGQTGQQGPTGQQAPQGTSGRSEPLRTPEGRIRYRVVERPALDLSSEVRSQGEQGLLGLAFAPDGRRLFVHFSDNNGDTQIVGFAMNANGVDVSARRRIFSTPQPRPNHNGGQLAFGPDGFLYVGLGDGGGFGDPDGNGQNPGSVLGSVLRIDPDPPDPSLRYVVPPTNPFVSGGGAPETWLYGVRNPWRFSFDRLTGDLWLADVGEGDREEVNVLPATDEGAGRAANLGWSLFEASVPKNRGADPGDLIAPLYDYDHTAGQCAVVGGFVYRGSAIPALQGTYVFGDFCAPPIIGVRATDGRLAGIGPLGVDVNQLVSFGQDNDGELWLLSLDGPVYRLVPS
jgi:glucose/arabinose dehydrogenase